MYHNKEIMTRWKDNVMTEEDVREFRLELDKILERKERV